MCSIHFNYCVYTQYTTGHKITLQYIPRQFLLGYDTQEYNRPGELEDFQLALLPMEIQIISNHL